jgi:adenosylcobinamide-phosphate synthase
MTSPPAPGFDAASVPFAALVVLIAFVLERTVGEPPASLHPVVWVGRPIGRIDREWQHPRLLGVVVAVAYPLAGATVAYLIVAAAWLWDPLAGTLAAALVVFASTSLRMLLREANAVIEATAAELPAARERLPGLAGRDAGELGPGQIRSAAVESAAENLADGLVAPLLAFALLAPLSVPLAAAGAWWVKVVNTLDSMLGYRTKPIGAASARLDDAVMWLPARVSAVLLSLAGGKPGALLAARPAAGNPPSPNSGWPMGVLASSLGVKLEKPGAYELDCGPSLPGVPAAKRGVRTVGRAGLLTYGLAGSAGVVLWL